MHKTGGASPSPTTNIRPSTKPNITLRCVPRFARGCLPADRLSPKTMLNIKIICVGTLRENYLRDACKEYEKRLNAYCKLTTVELKDDKKLLPALADKSYKIALCIEGKELSSPDFAALCAKAATAGQGTVSLVIGGADGLPEDVKAACDFRLSFSPMTFPHQLMRVILLEQLYRALNINSNGNYHH